MAPKGQLVTQAPQLMHFSGSMTWTCLAAPVKRADTLVIALSDHGTCYGEDGYEYHCISHETVYTVPYKHFILTKQ